MSALFRLCAYWFVMTAALGVYFPYFSLYLKEALGFSGTQVGIAFSVSPLVGMLAQPLWGHIADRSGSRSRVLTLLSAGTAVGYALLTIPRTFPAVLGAGALLAFFSTSQIPMAVAVSLGALQRAPGRLTFGRIRVWGTLGFFATVVGIPALLHALSSWLHASERDSFHVIFYLCAALAGCAALIAAGLPDAPSHERVRVQRGDQRWLVQHRPYLRVLFVSFAAYFFLQGPMVLFPVYIRSRGGSTATIGQMWTFMLTAETMLALSATWLYRRLGAKRMIAFGVLACGVRWTLCAYCRELLWIAPLQTLHGAMVISLQVASPMLVESLVPERMRSSSQAGLNMFGSSFGGILSATLAGLLLDARGIDAVLLVGGVGGLALGLAVPWILPSEPETSH